MLIKSGRRRQQWLWSALTTVGLLLGGIIAVPTPALAIGPYNNAAIADKALTYVGQWGGNACADAQKPGDSGGQCRAFVNCVVWMVSGHSQNLGGGSDYYRPFLNVGGVRITDQSQLVKGDIVQVGQGTHTFIIVGPVSSNTWDVVDSNASGTETVAHYHRTFALDDTTRAYRMGSAGAGIGGARAAFQASTATLYTYDSPSGAVSTSQGMAAGTSPSIAALVSGGYEEAFQANTGHLFVAGALGTFDTGLGMAAGTSPSITAMDGGYQIAFQANTGTLFLYTWSNGTAAATNLNQGMASGTSPAIAALAGGGYQIAFQANTGSLFFYGNSQTGNTGQGMAPGTSPAIAASSAGGFQAAFQANTGNLFTFWSGSGAADTGYGMMRGTNPTVAALANGLYEQAFQANTGSLWEYGSGGTGDRSQGMSTDSSPAISAGADGFSIAFRANTGTLHIASPSGITNTGQGLAAGTSPAIAG